MQAIANVLRAGMSGCCFSAADWEQRIKPFTRPFLDDVRQAFVRLGGLKAKSGGMFAPKGAASDRQAFDYCRFPVPGYPKLQARTDFKLTVSLGLFSDPTSALADKLWWGLYAYGSDVDPGATTYLPDVRRFVASRINPGKFQPMHRAMTGGWGPLLIQPITTLGPDEVGNSNQSYLTSAISDDLFDLQQALS